jgi:hypothetical protein
MTLIPNTINALGQLQACEPRLFFKHYENPRGTRFESYCCAESAYMVGDDNNTNIGLCCETPFVKDLTNHRCCEPTRYSISEERCCPDFHYLENDVCYINALVPTGAAVGAVVAGAGIAAYVMDQNNQAAAQQQPPIVAPVVVQPAAQNAVQQAPAPVVVVVPKTAWAEPIAGAWNAIMALAPIALL